MLRQIIRIALTTLLLAGLSCSSVFAEQTRTDSETATTEPTRRVRRLFRHVAGANLPVRRDNPASVQRWHPKYYYGLHYREFHRLANPTGSYPMRGTAW